ncbi:hypothetical protein [Chondromyces crocatus]|uniref:Integron gene cassette protein n=1 Tax=Chondromyces crocatus TaxID=52 RepID=A0A0K1ERK2_CHOCO|nr:hypothetical protein [Chondromyces crocatus]AKT43471.1 uncharacterized protein CMC5_077030 [Chondromyces crocatus]
MKSIVQADFMESEFEQYRGAEAMVWRYHATFRRIAISLSLPDRNEALYLVALGCRHIRGPFDWSNADIRIHTDSSPAFYDAPCRIVDEAARFELLCNGWGLVKALPEDFETSAENFLGRFPDDDVE